MITQCDWNIKHSNTDPNISFAQEIAKIRNISYPNEYNENNFHDPFDLNDIESAIYIISSALRDNKKILIYGDYDVDGICSTVSLYKFLSLFSPYVSYFIPNRFTDGYGLTDKPTQNIIKNHLADLVITVDNGISANKQIEMLRAADIQVIVTDHHLCPEVLPNAAAIINCHRKDNTYPFEGLCGAGVALKLIQALCIEFSDDIEEDYWKNFIEYTALATIADVVPLKDENLNIVLLGLQTLNNNPSVNFEKLISTTPKISGKKLTASDIAFYLAPKINAASRLDHIDLALDLFLSDNAEDISALCEDIEALNISRKDLTEATSTIATLQLLKKTKHPDTDPIIVYGTSWHKGIIGILASSFVDKYNRPAFVFSYDEATNILHGSCRSFNHLNIMEALDTVKDLLISYGGHEGAAGLSLSKDNYDEFVSRLSEFYHKYPTDFYSKTIDVDMQISFGAINFDNINSLNSIAPFGCENEEPLFMTEAVKIKTKRQLGAQKNHLQLVLEDSNGNSFPAMCFFASEYFDMLKTGSLMDIVYKININEWQGKKTIQLIVEDFHSELFIPKENLSYFENELYLDDGVDILDLGSECENGYKDVLPTKDEYIAVFNAIPQIFQNLDSKYIYMNIEVLWRLVALYTGLHLNAFKLFRILDVLYESGNIEYRMFSKGNVLISKNLLGREKTRLSTTNSFKKLASALS